MLAQRTTFRDMRRRRMCNRPINEIANNAEAFGSGLNEENFVRGCRRYLTRNFFGCGC